ncbi:MAG TPA: NAD(P)H-quinone oxidoreductase [Gemmatimonadales bacterium]|jgi:putative PIG3 family NAD(P)H quinone oxidoreductase|nr:NAD(P)H-quinone oxidoreductase [Gemmatimonadales bacterium]
MRAVTYTTAGGPEVIAINEVPAPTAGQSQVRVRVRAAGLNRADIYQRKGGYSAPPGWPADIPGLEYAGEIESLGPGVTRWQLGDRVMGLVGGGAQAELLAVRDVEVLPMPRSLSFTNAAAIPEVFYTAYDALVTRGRLEAGERVLIHAVGSGVGTAAAQIAKHLGATVIGTSRSAAKLARAAAYGVDVGIDTSRTGLRDGVGGPVDLIVDVIGGPALAEHLGILAPKGRLVILGLMGGRRGEIELDQLLHRRLEIIGSVMRSRGADERAALAGELNARLLPLFEPNGGSPVLRPVVDKVYPMERIVEAQGVMERNENFGKLVLEIP